MRIFGQNKREAEGGRRRYAHIREAIRNGRNLTLAT